MANHPNRSKTPAPCHDLLTTANARKQLLNAKAILAKYRHLFGGMEVRTTLDNGGKLSRTYLDSKGFRLTAQQEVNGYFRQLIIGQNGYGLHARYTVTESKSGNTLFWVGIAQTTEMSDFAEALEIVIAKRSAEAAKLTSII